MTEIIAVAVLGVVGVLARFTVDRIFVSWNEQFPVTTLVINISGAFIAGCIYALATTRAVPSFVHAGLLVGFCGGFTTFSAYALQSITLLESGRWTYGLSYLLLSPVLGALFAFAPIFVLRKLEGTI